MKPSLWVKTDLNAFFGLALDNVAVLILLLGLISGKESLKEQVDSGRFVFSPDFVVSHMIPGTALGVLVGDLAFSVMGFFFFGETAWTDCNLNATRIGYSKHLWNGFFGAVACLNFGASKVSR